METLKAEYEGKKEKIGFLKKCLKTIMSLVLIFFLISFFSLCWAYFVEPNFILLKKMSLRFEGFDSKMRVIHLTDFHSMGFGHKEQKVLEIIKKTDPDFVFLTGDIVDYRTKDLVSCFSFWQELANIKKGKVFAVLGNHEHSAPRFKEIVSLLQKSGILVLNNEARKIEIHNKSFYLIGVDDPSLGFDDIDKAVENVPKHRFQILLAHSPEIFKKIQETDISIVLVGHTHGGQINVPILSDYLISKYLLPSKGDEQYKSGLFLENGIYMYVNKGIGETLLPLRFNCFPEALLLEINQ